MNAAQDVRRGMTSASSAESDLLCPGRYIASQGLSDTQTEDALFGTQVHAALAANDPAGLSLEQTELYDSCREIEGKVVAGLLGEDLPHAKSWSELRLWVRVAPGIEHSGQVDKVYRAGLKAVILDYKTGRNEATESPGNMQLRDLSVLARGHFVGVTGVATVIIQPLVSHTPQPCLYEIDDLVRAEREMFARVIRSHERNAPRVPGDAQCKYCRAKSRCPEYQKYAGAMVPMMSSLVDMPMDIWTPEQWGLFLERETVARSWLDAAKASAKVLLEQSPSAIPGWGLKPGAVTEQIVNAQAAWDRFAALGGKLEAFMGTIKVGKTRLREAISVVCGLKGKPLDAKIKVLCDGITEPHQNAPSIVRKEDA